MNTFSGKVAIVTGGGSGIGRAVAQAYAHEEVNVVVTDVDDAGGLETVQIIRKDGGEADYCHTDVSNPADCESMVDYTLKTYGRLDIACNNAGIGGESNPTGAYSVDGWNKVISINLSGVFYCMRYEIPPMLQTGGSIINMASILGAVAFAGAPAYVAAKHGVVGLTKNAALEYAAQGIRVNVVGPAFIQTPLIAALEEDPQANAMLVGKHPIGRLGKPEEVAELVLWLSSDKASFVTGAYYPVDGGYLTQ